MSDANPPLMRRIDRDDAVDEVNALQRRLKGVAAGTPSRELSLAITKLDEARHWLGDITTGPAY